MGKRLIQQRRGRGSSTFRVKSHRFKGQAKHNKLTEKPVSGEIIDLINCPGHTSPLAKIRFENGEEALMIAPEGIRVGESVMSGSEVPAKLGNTLPLKDITEGTSIYNIESSPGDGGKFVRASGTFAKIVSKLKDTVTIKLPSAKQKTFKEKCRASIGVIAGSGRTEKPFLKAGAKFHKMRARNKYWPSVSGTSMNAVSHPFGGSSSSIKGRPTQSSRHAPPGRKVGKIAPRRTGRKR